MPYELIKRWRKNGFKLLVYATWRRDNMGKEILAYKLRDNDKLIFKGADFHCSPLHAIDSKNAVEGILGFLSLKPGDTDREYFDDYTPAQMEWCQSSRCEELAMHCYDLAEHLQRKGR
jgi:hypothetical protein